MSANNNQFIDSSPYNRTMTITGAVTQCSVGPKPLDQGAIYNPNVNGASLYYNSDALEGSLGSVSTVATSETTIGTKDCTIEFWINPTHLTSGFIFRTDSTQNLHFYTNATGKLFMYPGLSSINPLPAFKWTHVAVSRNSGFWRLFINGVLEASRTDAGNYLWNTNLHILGGISPLLKGYLSEFRLVVGTGLYTTNFTPQYILQSVPNTVLLLHFNNIGVYDATAKSPVALYGGTSRTPRRFKYGSSSLYFPGTTSDYALVPEGANPSLAVGTGDFTMECWVNTSKSNYDGVFACLGDHPYYFHLYVNNNRFNVNLCGLVYIADNTVIIELDRWYHVALVRRSGVFYFYIDGILKLTNNTVGAVNVRSSLVLLGRFGGGNPFNGYIDNFRVTKYARYITNFTPSD